MILCHAGNNNLYGLPQVFLSLTTGIPLRARTENDYIACPWDQTARERNTRNEVANTWVWFNQGTVSSNHYKQTRVTKHALCHAGDHSISPTWLSNTTDTIIANSPDTLNIRLQPASPNTSKVDTARPDR